MRRNCAVNLVSRSRIRNRRIAQAAVDAVRQVARDLRHELAVGVLGDAGDLDQRDSRGGSRTARSG
jgi:hypothetical protein